MDGLFDRAPVMLTVNEVESNTLDHNKAWLAATAVGCISDQDSNICVGVEPRL